jgi:hypothetical protein
MADEAFDPQGPLGPIGDEVLFENGYVRVWGLTLDPGERQAWHRHDLPYIVISPTAAASRPGKRRAPHCGASPAFLMSCSTAAPRATATSSLRSRSRRSSRPSEGTVRKSNPAPVTQTVEDRSRHAGIVPREFLAMRVRRSAVVHSFMQASYGFAGARPARQGHCAAHVRTDGPATGRR